MRYWDASALVALLVDESFTAAARTAIAEDPAVVTWWGSKIECTSAVSRLERGSSLSVSEARVALSILDDLAERWHEILPSEAVRETACRLLRVHSLRAADALQLSAAIAMTGGQPGGFGFLAFDERLRDAAAREGFDVGP